MTNTEIDIIIDRAVSAAVKELEDLDVSGHRFESAVGEVMDGIDNWRFDQIAEAARLRGMGVGREFRLCAGLAR